MAIVVATTCSRSLFESRTVSIVVILLAVAVADVGAAVEGVEPAEATAAA